MPKPASNLTHCRKFGWLAGDCERIHCTRCGLTAYRRFASRLIRAAMRHETFFFVTIYFNWQREKYDSLPLFEIGERDEKIFRALLTKILTALRKKARRENATFEYAAVLAFGRANHRIHKKVHCHVIATWLPNPSSKASKAHPDRLACPFLDEKLKSMQLIAWIEKPASRLAVARYTAANLKTIIGKPEFKNTRAFRFSQDFEGMIDNA